MIAQTLHLGDEGKSRCLRREEKLTSKEVEQSQKRLRTTLREAGSLRHRSEFSLAQSQEHALLVV